MGFRMSQSIHSEYMPKADTITALKDDGYGRRQIWDLLQLFRKSFSGREFSDIDRKFRDVVRKEPAHNLVSPTKPQSEIDQEDKRALDLANKPDNAHDRAVQSHNIDGDNMSKDDALAFYMKSRNET